MIIILRHEIYVEYFLNSLLEWNFIDGTKWNFFAVLFYNFDVEMFSQFNDL